MKLALLVAVAALAIGIRLWRRSRRRARAAGPAPATGPREPTGPSRTRGAVELVAAREIKERVKGRIFQVGTLVMLAVVVLAVVLPSIHRTSTTTIQNVGVVGTLSPQGVAAIHLAAAVSKDVVHVVPLASRAAAVEALRAGRVDVAILSGRSLLLLEPAAQASAPADPVFVHALSTYLGVLRGYEAAGLRPSQIATIARAPPVPVRTLEPGAPATRATPIIGLVLLFFMLTQYNTWILIGVMQEKSSRVVEVLLATLRPIQLLGGKVVGIGLVALAQAALVVGTALAAGAAVGSNALKGSTPEVLACELLWLLLGYAFYCWVYAAAGSTAERQDQVQTLALPISIPILIAYVFSITVAASGTPDLLFRVLAYLPPTAPFCMPVLVSLGLVTWWQFLASVLIAVGGTVLMARFAARIYRRAILQTRGRVRLRDLVSAARP